MFPVLVLALVLGREPEELEPGLALLELLQVLVPVLVLSPVELWVPSLVLLLELAPALVPVLEPVLVLVQVLEPVLVLALVLEQLELLVGVL